MTKRLSALVQLLLAIYGLYEVYKTLSYHFSSNFIPLLILLAVVVIWLSYEIVVYIVNPFVFRFFNAKPITSGKITELSVEMFIAKNGEAYTHSWRTFVYHSTPSQLELYDTLFVSGRFSGDLQTIYFSEDATVQSHKLIRQNVLLVFWAPKTGKVRPLLPYTHHYKYSIPADFSDDVNFYILYPVCELGKSKFKVNTYRKVLSVWAIPIAQHSETIDEQKALDLVATTKDFDLPQPCKEERGFSWSAYGDKLEQPILFVWHH